MPLSVRWNFPDWFDLATRGGEDFELLFTAPPEMFDRACVLFRRWKLAGSQSSSAGPGVEGDGPPLTLRKVDLTP